MTRAVAVQTNIIGMTVAVHIIPEHMTKEDYERVIKELEKSGGADPDGRKFHAAYGEENVRMFEVWDSEEQFDAHRERLYEVIQGAGLDAGTVEVHPVHSSADLD
jgi:quinol monooxygenase YgiN